MPDRIIQLKDGLVISCDTAENGTPMNFKKWEDTDISLKSLSEEQIIEVFSKLANGDVKKVEK
ncbi:MAG: hypothetical protein Ta2G_15190 [Termitinemataceae bacterium]|nr:MAG: hypothetical protein Ta2G_15190 [Termitinemataceae bacterium]